MKSKDNRQIMTKSEKIEDFQSTKLAERKEVRTSAPFRFFSSADCLSGNTIAYRRRDFFKISLLEGDYIVHYGDESIKVSGLSLSFFNPKVPYTIEVLKEKNNAGYLIFTDVYYDNYFKQGINQFGLFLENFKPIFILEDAQVNEVKDLFSKIEEQSQSDYPLKNDLIRNYINQLLHIGYKLNPFSERHHQFTSRERIYTIFNELLERQFPVDLNNQKLLRSASEYADVLNVHVNYLNRIVKEITGKSTSTLLYDRLLKEAIILLKHTNWTVSEIAFSLGFKDVSHFHHFFRKQTDNTPASFRVG
jgi:AraC-like DNA-binding protein